MTTHGLGYAGTGPRLEGTLSLRFPIGVIGVAVVLFAVLLFVVPVMFLARLFGLFLLPAAAGVVVLAWWVTRGRVSPRDRWAAVVAVVICAVIGLVLGHPLTRMFVFLWGVPATFAVVILFVAIARRGKPVPAMRVLVMVGVLGLVPWLLIRTNGQQGEGMMSFAWRWSADREQKLAAWVQQGAAAPRGIPGDALAASDGDWPAYRGPRRDGIARGVAIRLPGAGSVDFTPKLKWKHPVGVGWSSFTVVGGFAFTQEQRGSKQCVVCYDVNDGRQVWLHGDDGAFDEMSGGPGPRATPAVDDGRVYAFGPTGLLLCLDAATGRVLWSELAHTKPQDKPGWGYAASPLVADGKVIVGAAGSGGIALAAYDAVSGKPQWTATGGKVGFSSPVVGTVGGVRQVVYLEGDGVAGYALDDGRRLWEVPWEMREPKCAAPVILDDTTVLVGMGYGRGLRLLKIGHEADRWTAAEQWHAATLKPKFNDLVAYDGYVYGLDEGVMACVSLADGKRRWRGGRYGYGQLLLVGSHFIVLAESGEVAVVTATSEKFEQVGIFTAIEGKTWAHPVLVRGNLLVRNSDEAACYDLSPWLVAAPTTSPDRVAVR